MVSSYAFFRKAAVPLAILAWAGLLAGGFAVFMRYESVAGTTPRVTDEINPLFKNLDQPTLVVGLHPHCPCSKATVAELNKILGHAPGRSRLVVYAFKPKDEPVDWIASSTISSLNKLGARIEVDDDGAMAKGLGLNTSGQIQLFTTQGKLIYNGGITAGRGHEGDNAGEQAVIDLLLKGGS